MSETTARDGLRRQWTKIEGRWRMTVHLHDPVRDPEPVTVGTLTRLEGELLDALSAAQRENERLRKALVEARDRVSDPTLLRSNRIVRACEIIDAALSGHGGR